MKPVPATALARIALFAVTVFVFLPHAQAGAAKLPCVTQAEAARQPNAEVCVAAHVYDVVELKDGTRFLDVCPAQVADEDCRFLIVSRAEDREDVGELTRYRDSDIRLRGIVRPMHGRMGIEVSHVRQFSGGPEKFKPNPRLMHGWDAQSDRAPVRDPNLRRSGHARSFMNTRDTEPLPKRP